MKYVWLISIISFLFACDKESGLATNETDNKSTETNFLSFDIQNVLNGNPDSSTYSVYLTQEPDQNFELIDLSKSSRYLWFMPTWAIPGDTVAVLAKIRYSMDTELDIPYKEVDLEFAFMENKNKLEMINDSTFRYKQLEDFFTVASANNWGEEYNWSGLGTTQLSITLPEPIIMGDYEFKISSNGFYMPNEVINTSVSTFDEVGQSFSMGGSFDVMIKELSCGFYITHSVTNARFHVGIK